MALKFKIFILFLFLYQVAFAQPTICLNMIVKNESEVIRRALDSAKNWVDYWVIVDTGSTDGTQQIIQEHMKDIPGQLIERPWKNFAHNRNEAMEYALTKGEYILFLDADDWFEVEPDFRFPELIEDAYTVLWHHGEGCTYPKIQLIKSDPSWYWEGVWHEGLFSRRPHSVNHLSNIKYIYGADGFSSKNPEKFLQAVAVFQKALEDEPNNTRYVFYLAESLRDAGKPEEALNQYLKRSKMGGWEEEIFWSLLQVGHLKNTLGHPTDEIIESYYRAHRFRPHRPEPIYYLANLFNKTCNYALAYSSLKGYTYIPQPQTKDLLFNMDWISNHGLIFELSLASYYLGHIEEFTRLCHQLLAIEKLPQNFKSSVEQNLRLVI